MQMLHNQFSWWPSGVSQYTSSLCISLFSSFLNVGLLSTRPETKSKVENENLSSFQMESSLKSGRQGAIGMNKVNSNFLQIAFAGECQKPGPSALLMLALTKKKRIFCEVNICQFHPIYFFNASRKICSAFVTIGFGFTSIFRFVGGGACDSPTCHHGSSLCISLTWRMPPK